jgi:hypothetical protein
MGNFSIRLGRLKGPTLLLTIAFAPMVVYPFWLHFKDYSGPVWALLLPIPFPIIAGIVDHKLSAFQCAALLAGGAYTLAVADSIREALFKTGHWTDVIATVVFAALWFSTAIFLPTILLVMAGRASRGLLKSRQTHWLKSREMAGCPWIVKLTPSTALWLKNADTGKW